MAITLFRHGLTLGNIAGQYMGWNDSPLSEEAIAKLSSNKLSCNQYDLFVSSDLPRCTATMGLLFPGVTLTTSTDFREMDFGIFQGKTYDELKNIKDYQLWINDNLSYFPPDGESFEEFSDRLHMGWEKLTEKMIEAGKKSAFLVTHGGVIRYYLSNFAQPQREFWDWEISHDSGYKLTFTLDGLRRGERCTLLQEVPLTGKETG